MDKIISIEVVSNQAKYPDNIYALTESGRIFMRHAGKNGEWKEINPPDLDKININYGPEDGNSP